MRSRPMNIYGSPEYTASLREFGRPHLLKHCHGWILTRPVSVSAYTDAMGPYPLFQCSDWSGLSADLSYPGLPLVSLVLVSDPLGAPQESILKKLFPDHCQPFKTHFLADLNAPPEQFAAGRHRSYARKAGQTLEIFQAESAQPYLEDWLKLYNDLIARHDIRGIAAFSRQAFSALFHLSNLHIFVAAESGRTVAMQLWLEEQPFALYHLGASSERGYANRASFGLMLNALNFFRGRGIQTVNLGGAAGLQEKQDGLAQFKSGWSNRREQVFLLGKIFNKALYREFSAGIRSDLNYFPKYRTPQTLIPATEMSKP